MFSVRTKSRTAGPLSDRLLLLLVTNRSSTREKSHKHERPLRFEPRTFVTGTCAPTTHGASEGEFQGQKTEIFPFERLSYDKFMFVFFIEIVRWSFLKTSVLFFPSIFRITRGNSEVVTDMLVSQLCKYVPAYGLV